MLKLLGSLLVVSILRPAAAVAPGDESQLCTETLPAAGVLPRPFYPTNIKVLMDSYNYEALLPPQQDPVWQQVDLDDNNPSTITTNWIQQGANACRGNVFVCGFSAGPQSNWLITQLINRTVNGVHLQQVSAQIEYQLRGCEETLQCQRLFEVYKFETSSVNTTAARETINYELVTSVAPTVASGTNLQNETVTIDFATQNTSFYLAIRDVTSCIAIERILIFYTVCPSEISDLSIRPEIIAPIDSTLLQITTQCVPNANSGDSSQSISVCSQGGIWTTLPRQECTCNNGFFPSDQECTGCTVGEYFSFNSSTCQSCPANSNSTEEGVAVCPCFDGYYRAMGEEDLPCTSPPSAPRNVRVISVTNTSISLSWDPPEDMGGRDDFFYTLIAIEVSTMEIKRMTTVEGNVTTGVLGNLAPRLAYQVYVIAENGITDQLEQSDRLQSLGTSMPVTTLGGDNEEDGGGPPIGIIVGAIAAVIVIVVLVLLIVIVVAYVVVQKNRVDSKDLYSGEAIDLPTTGYRTYVDPSIYASPDEAVQDFAVEIPPKSIRLEEEIGRGEFGTVYRGTWKQQPGKNIPIAVKTLKPGSSVKMRSDFLNEAAIMGQFDHPNVISLYGVITKVEPAMIVMEFMDNGSLYSHLRRNDEKLGVLRLVKMARGVASGMDYLSTVGFVHRDLAARNILVSKDETCKVADFGLSRETIDDEYDVKKGGKIPVRWTAPEAIYRRKFTTSSDVWSYGVLMWEIMSYAQHPYDGYDNQTVLDRLEAGLRLEKPLGAPDMVYNIMLECWHHDNTRRPSFTSIVQTLDFLLESNLGQNAHNGSSHSPARPPKPKKSSKRPTSAKNPLDYETVDNWLQSIKMDRYAPHFENNGITAINQVVQITEDNLRQMGITLAGHLHRITESIEAAQLQLSRQQSTRI